jgi:hypothetical protein
MNKLEEYATITARMKTDKARLEIVKAEIEEEFGPQEHVEKTELGTFKMVPRTSWTHSDELVAQEEELKIAKEDEKEQWNEEDQTGPATPTTSWGVRFTPAKQPKD